MKKRTKYILIFVFASCLYFLLTGCTKNRYYLPDPQEISPLVKLKKDFHPVCSVDLVNAQTNKTRVFMGDYSHKWWANLHLWTESSISLLANELQKRGVKTSENSSRNLELSITRANLSWRFKQLGCIVNLRVQTGDGYTTNIEQKNISQDLYTSCDGAVSKAVASLFEDPEIMQYFASDPVIMDSDCDGVPDSRDKCPGTGRNVPVDKDGCPSDFDKDGVPDFKDKCPHTLKGAKVDELGCWNLPVPLFEFDKSVIKPEYHPLLNRVARVIKNNSGSRVEIHGHADIIGSEEYNKQLSLLRAEAVKNYLIKRGISEKRLKTKGYGYSKPRAPSSTQKGRNLNRRVEFKPIHE